MYARPNAVCKKPVLGLQQVYDIIISRCLTNRVVVMLMTGPLLSPQGCKIL